MFLHTYICYTFPLHCANNLHALLLCCAPISSAHCFRIAHGYSTCISLYALHHAKVQYSLLHTIICMPHRILCRYYAQLPTHTLAYTIAIQHILLLCAHQPTSLCLTILRTPHAPLLCVCTTRNSKFSTCISAYYSSTRWLNFP